jgi:hypothetical protein
MNRAAATVARNVNLRMRRVFRALMSHARTLLVGAVARQEGYQLFFKRCDTSHGSRRNYSPNIAERHLEGT